MLKENVINHRDRTPLFPGKSCYPLSPQEVNKNSSTTANKKLTRSRKD